MASSFAVAPRKGFVAPSVRCQVHGLPASSTRSVSLASAKPATGCWVRTTSGWSLSSSIRASSCGRSGSGIPSSFAPGATVTDWRKSLAEVIRPSDRVNWASGADSESVKSGGSGRPTSGVKATVTAAKATNSQASGPRKPSPSEARASAASRGATSLRMPQPARAASITSAAAAPSSQIGGSGISQRLASANRTGMGGSRRPRLCLAVVAP